MRTGQKFVQSCRFFSWPNRFEDTIVHRRAHMPFNTPRGARWWIRLVVCADALANAVGTYRLCQGTYTPDLLWHFGFVWLGLLFCWLQLRIFAATAGWSETVYVYYGFRRYRRV